MIFKTICSYRHLQTATTKCKTLLHRKKKFSLFLRLSFGSANDDEATTARSPLTKDKPSSAITSSTPFENISPFTNTTIPPPTNTTIPPPTTTSKPPLPLLEHFKSTIRLKGPISVAEYMQTILTNQVHGYYMHQDVFGVKGDFITSPEISQIFGELVGVWFVDQWMRHHQGAEEVRVVELGPGRGTLMKDLLRVFSKFPGLLERVSVHLVEVSPHLRSLQVTCLCGSQETSRFLENQDTQGYKQHEHAYKTIQGPTVTWHESIHTIPSSHPSIPSSTPPSIPSSTPPSIPSSTPPSTSSTSSSTSSTHPSFFLAHEFFDALPIHKFQKVAGKWREVMVDEVDGRLQLVTSSGDTVAKALLAELLNKQPGDHVEISIASLEALQQVAVAIRSGGGCGLVVDYGHFGDKGDTFRAFSKHRLTDPLENPGGCDVTADVNFKLLMQQVQGIVSTYGPVSQSHFLRNMGVGVRLKVLLSKAGSQERRDELISGYNVIMGEGEGGMGGRFKFLALKGGGGGGSGEKEVESEGGGGGEGRSDVPAGFES